MATWIRGDYLISGITLSRLFAFHVVLLPIMIIAVVFFHVLALHEIGSNNPDGIDIKIIDNGLGMSEEKIGNIFDRFYQVENNPSKINGYGSGIGLALSKGIIESHKGKISVESQLNQGSVFHTSLKKGKSHFDPGTTYIEQDYTFNKSYELI